MKRLKITTLSKGWHNKDEVLLHAAFQLLTDFVEKERPDKIVDWDFDERHKNAWAEITSLYEWWTETRPKRRSPLDSRQLKRPPFKLKKIPGSKMRKLVRPGKKKYAAYYEALKEDARLENEWYEEDQRNLHRLIEIRGFLWT
jgi:hypothetical protein